MMRLFVAFVLGVSLWEGAALAQLLLTAPSAPPPASPTQVITLVFDLKNNSSERDIFEFSLELPNGVQLLSPPEPVELAPGEDEKVFISLLITAQARAGAHPVTFNVRGRKNPALTARASVTITVKETPGLQVLAPPETSVEPGSALLVRFTVRNTGNAPDRIELSVSARAGFSVRLSIFRRLDLGPGEAREVPVEVVIPKQAPPGRERILLKAVSQRFENLSAEATAILSVLPPLPQHVGGSLFLTVPAGVEFRVEGQTGAPVNAFAQIQSL
ncbi:MAG: NEW3 domain-containing protein, partial [Candidatus Bipolaricaulota bacterium]|nr:NEW3 domain-containing protein [Candidatus Bipolaricaulota bacterium]